MSGDIIQLNPEAFQSELKGLVKNSIEETLNAMPMDTIKANGYIFQVEMNYVASKLGFKAVEIPIYFQERTLGTSKMSLGISYEAAWRTLTLRSQHKDVKPIK